MITFYGLKNCDACNKARKFLNLGNINFEFFDLKERPLSREKITKWLEVHSLEKVVNKRSTTWRNLDEELRNKLEINAIEIMIEFPSLVKRPFWEIKGVPNKILEPGFGSRHQDFIKNQLV